MIVGYFSAHPNGFFNFPDFSLKCYLYSYSLLTEALLDVIQNRFQIGFVDSVYLTTVMS